jgi:hypothetical protein
MDGWIVNKKSGSKVPGIFDLDAAYEYTYGT